MIHYDFQKRFRAVYERALAAFESGAKDADALLSADDAAFARSYGGRPQDFFDYAEDALRDGEPDFETALLVEAVRRDYFLAVQHGTPSPFVLLEDRLPDKAGTVRGIAWLPRLLPKAKAKLRGGLPPGLMYCCGGDRRFFKARDIHPAEFLRAVWAWEDRDARVVDWVEARAKGGS
jgi:hypothetical protein